MEWILPLLLRCCRGTFEDDDHTDHTFVESIPQSTILDEVVAPFHQNDQDDTYIPVPTQQLQPFVEQYQQQIEIPYLLDEENLKNNTYMQCIHFQNKTWLRFQKSFDSPSATETMNNNIPAWFYDKKETLTRLRGSNRNQERLESIDAEWATRQSMISTPLGVVVMRYCPSKQAFEYWANGSIRPDILDACAMIFCMQQCCRDLCVSYTLRPENRPSPIPIVDLSEMDPQYAVEQEEYDPFFGNEVVEVEMDDILKRDRRLQMEEKRKRDKLEKAKKEAMILASAAMHAHKRTNRYIRIDRVCGVYKPTPFRKKPMTVFSKEQIEKCNKDYGTLFDGCKEHKPVKKNSGVSFEDFVAKHNLMNMKSDHKREESKRLAESDTESESEIDTESESESDTESESERSTEYESEQNASDVEYQRHPKCTNQENSELIEESKENMKEGIVTTHNDPLPVAHVGRPVLRPEIQNNIPKLTMILTELRRKQTNSNMFTDEIKVIEERLEFLAKEVRMKCNSMRFDTACSTIQERDVTSEPSLKRLKGL